MNLDDLDVCEEVKDSVRRARPRVQVFFPDPSLTRQEFKDECDLALLLKRYFKTPEGLEALQNASGMAAGGQFADVSAIPDFHTARNALIASRAAFERLPQAAQQRFDGLNAGEFLAFIDNPANLEELRSLGLLNPKPEVSASPTHVST